jgi:hypothetical protein
MRFVRSMTTTCALSAATLAVVAAPAAAAPVNGGGFPTIYILGQGPCVGSIDTSVGGSGGPGGGGYPDSAVFGVEHTLAGVGPCSVDVSLQWRNLDTGETGTVTRHIEGPGFGITDPPSNIFRPGFGRFAATVSVNTSHTPESGELQFTVTPYRNRPGGPQGTV